MDLASAAHASKRAASIQQDSFVMSVCLEHNRLKSAVEDEVFGDKRTSVFRTLRARVVESTAPGCRMSRARSANKRSNPVMHSIAGKVRKTCGKTRRVSGYNAFQTIFK